MNLNGLDYPYDTDLVWVGLDKNGFVGTFVTAGQSVQFNLSEYVEVEQDLSCLNGF